MSADNREHQRAAWAGVRYRGEAALGAAIQAEDFRRTVWALRDIGRESHPLHRCASCGWSAIGAVGISRREDGRHTIASVATCGSVWGCPVCASVIKGERAEGIKEGLDLHRMHFGGVDTIALGTFTVSHAAGDGLRYLAEGFQRAWNKFLTRIPTEDKQARALARRKRLPKPPTLFEQFGYLGFVSGAEITWGKANGWHYHRHPLFFFDRPLTEDDRKNFEARSARWWQECVVSEMGERHRPSLERGVTVKRMNREDYISKLGLEVSDVGTKQTKNGNLTPWGLQQSAASGHGEHWSRWSEYCESTKGLKAVQQSDGLRALWMRLGWKPEAEDDGELADESKGAILIRELSQDEWRDLRRTGRVCEVLESDDPIALLSSVLAAHGTPKARSGWGDGERVKELDAWRPECRKQIAELKRAGLRGETKREKRERLADEDRAWRELLDSQAVPKAPIFTPVVLDLRPQKPKRDNPQLAFC